MNTGRELQQAGESLDKLVVLKGSVFAGKDFQPRLLSAAEKVVKQKITMLDEQVTSLQGKRLGLEKSCAKFWQRKKIRRIATWIIKALKILKSVLSPTVYTCAGTCKAF
jgi:hypothetical protein